MQSKHWRLGQNSFVLSLNCTVCELNILHLCQHLRPPSTSCTPSVPISSAFVSDLPLPGELLAAVCNKKFCLRFWEHFFDELRTSLQAFLLFVSVGSLLYLYASHITCDCICCYVFYACSYHDIVATPEWILVHLHRVEIGVGIASLRLTIQWNVRQTPKKQGGCNIARWESSWWKMWRKKRRTKKEKEEIPDSRSYRHSSRSGGQRQILAPASWSLRC